MSMVVYQGASAPESYAVTVKSNDVGNVDMTTPTAATMHVELPDGEKVTWAATISSATALQLVASHVFAANDLPLVGKYAVVVALTVSGGTLRSRPQSLTVLDQYQAL